MKCKHPVKTWKKVGRHACLDKCKVYAEENNYEKTFCCAYNKESKKCMVSKDGKAKTKGASGWNKAKGIMKSD